MNRIFSLILLSLGFSLSAQAQQIDTTKVIHIDVHDSIANPVVVVWHSMGNINVKGHKGAELVVYAEEMLPSVSDLVQQNQEQVFQYIDSRTRLPVTVNRNAQFNIQQIDNYFQIETNIFSFNSNVFVMTPVRSSVSVNSQDIGNIFIQNLQGDVEATGNAGSIYIQDVDGVVSASTVHGNVVADLSDADTNKPMFISTFVGNIEVIVPKSSHNSVLLSSEMGNLYSNFDTVNTINISAQGNSTRNRKLKFDLNGGGTEFVLNTYKGDIYLRYQD